MQYDVENSRGRYWYASGYNKAAILALIIGIVPNVPGFLSTIGLTDKEFFPQWMTNLYNYAWFVGFFLAGFSYLVLMKRKRPLNQEVKLF